jgi:peptidoglycan/LPS O-acetylase OafA/YrhL
VFFVLSGFLITTLLLEEHDCEGRIRLQNFYARRGRRLLPAMGAMLVMVSLLSIGTYQTEKLAAILAAGGLYAANVVRASSSLLAGTPLDHTWSLAIEEQFYLIWPPVLIVLLRRRSRRVVAGLGALFVALVAYRAVLAGFGASEHRLYFAPDTHADGLVVGCFAAFVRSRGFTMARSAGWAAVMALVTLFALGHQTAVWDAVGLPAVEVAAAVLVLAAVRRGVLAALLAVRPLAWLGAVSYKRLHLAPASTMAHRAGSVASNRTHDDPDARELLRNRASIQAAASQARRPDISR